jgi:hypothetical protein
MNAKPGAAATEISRIVLFTLLVTVIDSSGLMVRETQRFDDKRRV